MRTSLADTQLGFLHASGIRSAVFAVNNRIDIDAQGDLSSRIMDYKNASDKVQHNELLHVLQYVVLGNQDLTLVQNINWDKWAKVAINEIEKSSVTMKESSRAV